MTIMKKKGFAMKKLVIYVVLVCLGLWILPKILFLVSCLIIGPQPTQALYEALVVAPLSIKCRDPYVHYNIRPELYYKDPETLKLARAIRKNDIPKIKKLVAQGADVNAMEKNFSLLCYAIYAEDETFRCLLELGANPLLPWKTSERWEWEHSALGRLCRGDGTCSALVRFRGKEKKNEKFKDAMRYTRRFSEDGKLPEDMLFYIRYCYDRLHRIEEAIDAGADVCYQKNNESSVTYVVRTTKMCSEDECPVLLKMLQGGADMCAVSAGDNRYHYDVCLWAAKHERDTPEYSHLN